MAWGIFGGSRDQSAEIRQLKMEVQRQFETIERLRAQLSAAGINPEVNVHGVSLSEQALAREGRKIEAIKSYRERTGASLVDAKKAIDQFAQ